MSISVSPSLRVIGGGAVAAAVLIGAFALGASRGSAASANSGAAARPAGAQLASAAFAARVTVTGTGLVTGTPNQLSLDLGVQVNGATVTTALQQANQAVSRVTGALRAQGVAAGDIQTSGLSVQPNYAPGSQVPDGYAVAESLTATLDRVSAAGAQIEAAINAGGNAVTVDGVSLNLTDTSGLLATARARAIGDARAKAADYARALGQQLGPVVSISDQAAPPSLTYPMAASAAARAASVPISPGSQQLSVSVTVMFALA
jgi:uncharacterized protein